MTHGSLFSGIGGFDLAAEWMGWENLFHCECNPFGQKVLKHYWPNSELFTDITTTDFTKYANRIDVLTGGFPCQPYSTAGKRLGKEDERHLWPEMLRAIREIKPRWVVGENVRGIISWNEGVVFDEVQSDLEAAGYEVLPFLLPACGVNAPHQRYRVWFVAHAIGNGHELRGFRENRQAEGESTGFKKEWERVWNDNRGVSESWDVANSSNTGLQGRKFNGASYEKGQVARQQPSRSASELCKISNWEQFPTQSPVCSGNDGFPAGLDGITFSNHRTESLKAYGNAVVPQVVYQIFKAIEQYELNPYPA